MSGLEHDIAAVLALVRVELPELRAAGLLARSLKCQVIAASLGDRPVVLKWLARPDALWSWYFERERRLLAALAASGEREVGPELLASGPRWMVLERLGGAALAAGRFARYADVRAVTATLAARRRLARAKISWPTLAPDDATRAEMRARLLEDPSDGLGWCLAGLRRGAGLGLIDGAGAALAITALERWPTLAGSHGDLLPRNVIVDDGAARLVDLECAGEHPEAWDHALLWANVPAAGRRAIAADFGVDAGPRGAAFWACVVFALVRELKFARGRRLADELRETLRDAVAALRACSPGVSRYRPGPS